MLYFRFEKNRFLEEAAKKSSFSGRALRGGGGKDLQTQLILKEQPYCFKNTQDLWDILYLPYIMQEIILLFGGAGRILTN